MLVRDILLTAIQGNPTSEGIAISTKSPRNISHSALEIRDTGEIIEAEFFTGVVKSESLYWHIKNKGRKKYYSDWYESKVDPYQFVGEKYFKGFFVNFLLYRIFCWAKMEKYADNVINRSKINQMICSTINARCRGIYNYWRILPKDLEQFVL